MVMNDLKGLLKKHKRTIETCPLPAEYVGFLAICATNGSLTMKQVKALLVKHFEENLYAEEKQIGSVHEQQEASESCSEKLQESKETRRKSGVEVFKEACESFRSKNQTKGDGEEGDHPGRSSES